MSVKTEVKSLRRICMQGVKRGMDSKEVSTFIYLGTNYRTSEGCITLDIYSRNRALADDNSAWDVDQYEQQRLMLPIRTRHEFRRAYQIARLVRGRPRSREMLLHWRTYG
ncbi:TPA: hypothetical protein ACGTPR_000839 [Salmonella enterica]